MSQRLISRNPDLQRLRDEGFEVEIRGSYLLLGHIPYVMTTRKVGYGTLVSTLNLAGEQTTRPDPHTVWFDGGFPCDEHGNPLTKIGAGGARQQLREDLVVEQIFSSKPACGYYRDYYEKMATYAAILAGPAQQLEPKATARTFRVIECEPEESVFAYLDTASSRAGIAAINDRLAPYRVAIIGCGGTGDYVYDLVVKTPVCEIHLWDGDRFLSHNAFRAPGAATLSELNAQPNKAEYLKAKYAAMRPRGVSAHPCFIDASNVSELEQMDFVFICVDRAPAKKLIAQTLVAAGVPFIDVGIGMWQSDGQLGGQVRVTSVTPEKNDHLSRGRIPFAAAGGGADQYRENIQIADLNALNAALAVIKWKKLAGFYADVDGEHHSVYDIDGNALHNEEEAA